MNRSFRTTMLALAVAIGALFVPSAAPAAATVRPAKLGNRLVNRYFGDLEHHNVADLRRFLSPAFQLQRADGSRQTKAQVLSTLPTVRSYRLRRLRATASGSVLVTTYEVAADEVVNGKTLRMAFAPRISTFVRGGGGWQIASHANFNTPK